MTHNLHRREETIAHEKKDLDTITIRLDRYRFARDCAHAWLLDRQINSAATTVTISNDLDSVHLFSEFIPAWEFRSE
jgi:hypothetical protein